jgi:hypothetical protein
VNDAAEARSAVRAGPELARRKGLADDARLEVSEMAETTTAAETGTTEWVEEFVERWLVAFNSGQPERSSS